MPDSPSTIRMIGQLSTVGLSFVLALAMGFGGGYWLDLNGRRWYEDLQNRVATDKSGWAAMYNLGSIANINSVAIDSPDYRRICEAVYLSQRVQLHAALTAVINASGRYPNCKIIDYDSTSKAGLWWPANNFGKRWGAFPGAGAAFGHYNSRNLYASNQAFGGGNPTSKMRVKPTGALKTLATEPRTQFISDGLTLQSMIVASRLPICSWQTPYDSYPTFSAPLNTTFALEHHVMVSQATGPAPTIVWFQDPFSSSTGAQDLISTGIAAIESALTTSSLPSPSRSSTHRRVESEGARRWASPSSSFSA